MTTPALAVTMGDPGGIGPEIALRAALAAAAPRRLQLALVGSRRLLAREARRLRRSLPPAWTPAAGRRWPAPVVVWEPATEGPARARDWPPGRTGRAQGQAAAGWIRAAVDGCLAGVFDGLVTGPVCKQSLHLAGLPFPGHTEFLAALTNTRRYAMLLVGGGLRVALATRHLPLAQVAASLTRRGLVETAVLTTAALRWLGVRPLTIAVCALNPHAGDGGLLGREETQLILPAIRAMRRRGLAVAGPVAGDVAFHQARAGRYGAVLAMYHDQGLGPLKTLAFASGVNLTLGLPILRTSPDHGTALDIAGRGRADPGSMLAAIRLAARLARRPNPWARRRPARR